MTLAAELRARELHASLQIAAGGSPAPAFLFGQERQTTLDFGDTGTGDRKLLRRGPSTRPRSGNIGVGVEGSRHIRRCTAPGMPAGSTYPSLTPHSAHKSTSPNTALRLDRGITLEGLVPCRISGPWISLVGHPITALRHFVGPCLFVHLRCAARWHRKQRSGQLAGRNIVSEAVQQPPSMKVLSTLPGGGGLVS